MTESLSRLQTALGERYTVQRELGRGGMATVYLATDVRHHRAVAIKVLRPELASALGPERFLREIQIAAPLAHPHILPLYDSGDADGLLYYVTPFIEGESLRERLTREHQLPLEDALQITTEVADGLGYAHSRGIVHRDIKPENILLSGGHALVADFGIARAVEQAGTERLTDSGMAIGTPAYMSPEQAAGSADVDARSDLYSLGCVLYEMLSGEPPHTGPSAQAILAKKLSEPASRISVQRETVPAAVEAALGKVLARTPADRFATASAFSAALHSDAPVAAPAAETTRSRRRWVMGTAIAVVLLALAAGVGWVTYTGRPGTLIGNGTMTEGGRVVLGDFTNHTTDSLIADAVREELRFTLSGTRLVRLSSPDDVRSTLRYMKLAPTTPLVDTIAREVAERQHAKVFIVGDVSRLGSAYQLTARIVGVDGKELKNELVVAKSEEDVITAVGDLGKKLRRDIGESLAAALTRPALADVTTRSMAALRDYTAAWNTYYFGAEGDPVARLRQAIARDSEFVSAYALLGLELWRRRMPGAKETINAAYVRRAKLPDRERLVIERMHYRIAGDLVGEASVLQQMLALDPHDEYALAIFADLRLQQRRFAAAESLATRAVNEDETDGVALANLLSAQLAQGHVAKAESAVAHLPPNQALPPGGKVFFALSVRDWGAAADWLDSNSVDPFVRHWDQISVDLVHGRLHTLGLEHEQNHYGALWEILAVLRYTGDTTRALELLANQIKAAGWDTAPPPHRGDEVRISILAEAGHAHRARELLNEWIRVAPDDPQLASYRQWCEGVIALAEGNVDSAVAAFLAWNAALPPPGGDAGANQGFPEAAAALDRAGRRDSALVLYERALTIYDLDNFLYEIAWYPLVLRRVAEIHAARGERAQAIAYYNQFIDLWKDADPELQPQVREARAALARLTAQ